MDITTTAPVKSIKSANRVARIRRAFSVLALALVLPATFAFEARAQDPTPPAIESVAVTRSDGATVSENDEWAVGEVLAFTWTFTEPVVGFDETDLELFGADSSLSVGGFTGGDGATVFTANLTLGEPGAAATVNVRIRGGRIEDALGNMALDPIDTFTLAPEPLRIVSIARAAGAAQLRNDPAGLAFDIEFNRAHGLTSTDADTSHFRFQADDDPVSGTYAYAPVAGQSTMFRVTLSTAGNFPTGEPAYTVGVIVQPPGGAAPGAIFTTTSANRRLDPALPVAAETYTVDNARPTVTIEAPVFAGGAFDVVLNFSEAIMGFGTDDILVENATVTNLVRSFRPDPVSGGTLPSHTVTITPVADNTVDIVISMAENAFTDLAGNSNAPASRIVAVPPRIASIIRHDPEHTNADFVTWNVNFSEGVLEVTTADFAVTGVPPVSLTINDASPLSGGIEYEVEVGGAALADYNGTLTLGLAPGFQILDTNSNPLTDATPIGENHTYAIDNRRPQVTSITGPDDFRGASPFTITVVFDEPVMDFDGANDIAVTPATVAAAVPVGGSPATTWTAVVTPTLALGVFESIVINVADSVATDRAGNGNVSAALVTIPYNAPPTVVSIVRDFPAGEIITGSVRDVTWLVTFSEDVTGVDESDFTVTIDPMGLSGSMVFDVTDTEVTPLSGSLGNPENAYEVTLFLDGGGIFNYDGPLTLTLTPSGIEDTTGNALIGANPTAENQSYIADNGAPTSIIDAPSEFVDQPFQVTFTFSESVVNFVVDDITAQNATVGSFTGSGATYAAVVTPAAAAPDVRADIIIELVAGVAEDRAGNATRLATATVSYNEPIITLTLDNPSIFEDGGIAMLSATIVPAAATATMITVALTPQDPATAANYNITGTTLTVPAGATASDVLQITPVNDNADNDDRVININATVVGGGGAVTFADSVTLPLTLTITDDEMDLTPPRLASIERMTPPDEDTNADTLVWLATFNEPVSRVDVSDFEVVLPSGATGPLTTATVTDVSQVTVVGMEYRVTVSGGDLDSYDGMVGLAIAAGHDIEDQSDDPMPNALVERASTGANDTYTVDNTAPTVESITAPGMYTDTAFEITVVFNEEVEGFTTDGITISSNATVSAVAATGDAPADTWTATITPTNAAAPDMRAAITIDSIAASAAQDRAGNASEAFASPETVAYDEPMITLTLDTTTILENGGPGGGATVSATIDPVAATDTIITVTLDPQGGAMASDYSFPTNTLTILAGMAESDSLTITPLDNGANNVNREINITATATGGAVTFANDPPLPLTLTIVDDDMDSTPPTVVSIARMEPMGERTNANALLWLVTFSEGVTGVDEGDFTVTGAPQITLVHEVTPVSGSPDMYDVEVSDFDNPTLANYDGTVTLALVANPTIEDLSVNPSANALTDITPTGENQSYIVDNTAPTVTITNPPSEFVDEPFQVTITFNDPVENFNIDAISVENATRSNLTGSGETHTVTITPATAAPNARQDITITIAAGAAQDLAGNDSEPLASPVTVSYNEPVITLTLTPTSIEEDGGPGGGAMVSATIDPVAATATTIVVALEPQGGAMASDYLFPNTVLTIPAGETDSNMLPITAVDNDDNNLSRVINITAMAAGGAVTFANADALPLTLTIADDDRDVTPPRLASIERMTPPEDEPTNMDTLTWRVTFNEGVALVDAADFSVTGTPPVSLTPTVAAGADARIYQVSVTGPALADYDGTLTLALVVSPTIEDLSVNPRANALINITPTGVNETYAVDNTAPTVESITAPGMYTDTAFEITVVFNEEVEGFTTDGITISSNATVSAVAATGSAPADTWTATVTPTNAAAPDMREDITITIAVGAANDRAGNASEAFGETETVAYDEPKITLILDPASIQENGGAGGGAAVSATIDPVAATDTIITVTLAPQGGAMASDYMFPDTMLTISAGMTESDSLTITPVDNGGNNVNRMINITATATGGAVTFANDPALPLTLTIVDDDMDSTAPTVVSIARMTPSDEDTNADTLLWLVTFSEGVTGVEEGDFTVTGNPQITLAHVVSQITDSTYEVELEDIDNLALANYDGTVTLALVASPTIEDLSVNPSANALTNIIPTGVNETYTVDNTAPTVTITNPPTEFVDAPFQVTITFSEPVENFNINAITVANAAPSDLTGSGDTYMVTITPATAAPNTRQDITINSIAAGAAQDLVGNASVAFASPVTVAYNEPMITLTLTPASIQENGGSVGAAMVSATIDPVAATATMITVTLEPQGGAMASDYEFPNAVLTIPAGETDSNMLPITAVDNDDNNLSRVINITAMAAGGAVTFANADALPLTLTIADDDRDVTPPRLASIERMTPPEDEPTNMDTLTWRVTFNEGVALVDAADFSVTGTPPVSLTPTVAAGADARIYQVSVTGAALADYDGTLTLALVARPTIEDLSVNPGANALTNTTPLTGVNEPYTVDNTAPTISTIARSVPSSGTRTNVDTLGWRVTFNEAVTVDNDDFSITFTNTGGNAHTPATAPTVTAAMGADATIWDLTATGGDLADFDGAVVAAVATVHGIEDEAGNALTNATPGSAAESWTLDNAAPTAMIDVPARYNPAFEVTITFNEPVTGFDDAGDVTATPNTSPNIVMVSAPTLVSGNTYEVTVTPPSGYEGDIVVTLAAGAATDRAGNMNAEQTADASTFEPTMVTLALDDNSISENGGMATVTATIAPAATVDTTITVSATAVDPAVAGDFTLSNPAVLTIAMGATESTGTVTITAVDNTADSNDKEVMVTATVTGATTAAPAPLTLTIEDDDLPTVSVMADTSAVGEGTASADVFTITRAVATSESVAVQYTITERDVTSNTRTATIDADQTSVMVAVDLSNDTFDGATTVGITLLADATNYNRGATTTTTRPITDDPEDKQAITAIAVTPDPVVEGQEITVTLTRGNLAFNGQAATLGGVMVQVVVGTQTAQPLTVAFAANSLTGSATFTIPDDSVVENDYQVTATVQPNDAYAIASGLTGESVTVTDDDRTDAAGAPLVASATRMTPSSEHTNADTLTWLVTFNEHVTGVEGADFMAAGLTAPTVSVSVDEADLVLSAEVTVTGGGLANLDGAVSLRPATGATIADGSGTALVPAAAGHAASETYTVDNTAPTATTITVPPNYNPPFAVTITFNEPVTEFDDVGDVTATNATMVSAPAPVGGSDTMYTATVTPDNSQSEIAVALAANAATDRAGNMSAAQMATSTSTYQATVVTLALSRSTITEGATNGTQTATVTATISPMATADTTITVSAAAVAPAVAGDFTLSSNAVLAIAMGATESTGTVTITAVDNTADSNNKAVMVTATVTGATTAAPAPQTLTITDDDLPTVSVMADTSAVDEGTASANVFTITRAVATSESVDVQYTITERGDTSGTQMATIAADQTSVMVEVDLSNDTFDGATTVGITLVADAATYNLGATTSTIRPITDDPEDKQEITAIAVTPDPVVEGANITVTLTRGNLAFSGQAATLADVAVQVVVGTQTAQPLTVAFAANSLTGSGTFTIPDNSVVENDYQVIATVQTNPAYDIASGLAPASVAVTDNDQRVDVAGAPTITSLARHNPTSERTNADSLTWRVMFNEHVTGVGADDFAVTGPTGATVSVAVDGSALAADALTRSVDVTVTGGNLAAFDGAVSLQLATGAMIRDGQDQNDVDLTAALPATAESYSVDNTAPTISTIARSVPSSGTRTNADTLGWRVTFNEAVTVDNDDFSITFTNTGGNAHTPATAPTVTAAMGADATIWDLSATGGDLADFDGAVVAAVATGHGIADTASNALTNTTPGTAAESWTVDNTAPALTAIAAPNAGSNEVGTGAVTPIDFTFDASDLDVASLSPTISPAGSTITPLMQDSTDPMKYTGTLTADSEPGMVTITLAGYRDDVGNQGTATRTLTLTILDVPTPTLSAEQVYVLNNGVIPVTITFDQDVTGFDAVGDITVDGGTATAPTMVGGSASEYTTMITSTGNPTTVSVAAGVAMSAATGQNNVASKELIFTREPNTNTPTQKAGVPRLAEVTIPSGKDRSGEILNLNDTLEFVLRFDEAVLITSVECEDFAPPTGFECTRVQAVVGATPAPADSDYATHFDLTYTLTGEVDRAIQDVGVALSSTRTITDQTGESLTGTQASGASAEHKEIAVDTSALATTLMDVAATGLAISLVSEGALSPPLSDVEIRFGESATYDPNAEGALELEGATLESAVETRAGFIWTLTLRLDPGVTDVIVTIPEDQAMDTRGEMNKAVARTFAVNQSQSEREIVADFMLRRGAHIMAARPDFIGLLDGSGIGTSSLKLDDGPTRTFAFAGTGSEIAGLFGKTSRGLSLNEEDRAAARGDLWMSLKGIRTRTDDAEDDFYSMSVGAHRRLGADHIAGAFIAVDQSKTEGRDDARNDSVEGDGWLAGPYLVGRVADRGLYYQVHAAWGQSRNAVRVGEGDENSFDTDRWLVGGALKGDYQLGEWSISPIVSADWFREEQEAYMSGGNRVDDQDITLGEVRAGPQFRRVLRLDSGADLSFKLGLHGVHNLAVDAEGDAPSTFEDGDTRGQVDVDFGYALKGAHLDLGLRYDGIGQDDYESWGADVRLRVTF